MDNYAAISVQHAQNVARLSAALEVLYAGLSPDQKRAADELFQNYRAKSANGSGH
jgi:phage host-nuclease inhibitor protein Gam